MAELEEVIAARRYAANMLGIAREVERYA